MLILLLLGITLLRVGQRLQKGMLSYWSLVLVNGNLFENGVLADAVKMSVKMQVGLNPKGLGSFEEDEVQTSAGARDGNDVSWSHVMLATASPLGPTAAPSSWSLALQLPVLEDKGFLWLNGVLHGSPNTSAVSTAEECSLSFSLVSRT